MKDLMGLGPTVHPQGTTCDGGGLILGSKLIHRKRGVLWGLNDRSDGVPAKIPKLKP